MLELVRHVEEACALGGGFLSVSIGMLCLTLLLRRIHPAARGRLRVATLMQVAGLAGLVIAGALLGLGLEGGAFPFRLLRDTADVSLAVSIVTISGVLLFDYVLGPLRLRPPGILTDLILAAGYVAVTILVLAKLGHDVSSVLTTGAIATAAIGFSLQDTLRSVMGGMSLQIDRSVSQGDWIRVDSTEGRVSEIRWRRTSIVTRDGNTVVIPNAHLASTLVTILGKNDGREVQSRRSIYFEVDHGVPTGEVIAAVEAALRGNPVRGMAVTPPADCVLMDLRSGWQTFAARYWLRNLADDAPSDSAVRARVIAALQRIGVGFSFPSHSVLLHPKDARHLDLAHEHERQRRLRALASVALFAPLTSEELAALAERLRLTTFSPGEVITRQGATANWLYIVVRGVAGVRVTADAGGPDRRVASLEPGSFFGEMALLTGAPRSATVIAESDVSCYKLDKESFLDVLQARPGLAEEISRLLARRRVELDAAREQLGEEARRKRLEVAEHDMLARIRNFFRLH
ncbi:MAG: mechanosensitive ion channel family protein [Deltaproteobacteria bacterium]|nr:mechanosensitive ion channel family protein [Deltaproteobacteria bacterium]